MADCNQGEIYLNGVRSPQLGALGNDWEGFVLAGIKPDRCGVFVLGFR
ncbi:MAG: hypothetical protein V8R50_01485 [Clostridia bacterium]